MKRFTRIPALILILALVLPVAALAVTEGRVEAAPDIDLYGPESAAVWDGSYLPDASWYYGDAFTTPEPTPTPMPVDMPTPPEAVVSVVTPQPVADVGGVNPLATVTVSTVNWAQFPALNSEEAARARALLDAYSRGEVTGDGTSVLNALEDVVVGVYPLAPDQYAGQHAYVLLPDTTLTDEQLLSLIDAFRLLGLTFDPDDLSYMNCARGGGTSMSRVFADEEQCRLQSIAVNIREGRIARADVAETAARDLRIVRLNENVYGGLEIFKIIPYRSLTDEELTAECFAIGMEPIAGLNDYLPRAYALARILGAPLSISIEQCTLGRRALLSVDENNRLVFGDVIPTVCVNYIAGDKPEADRYIAYFHQESGEVVEYSLNRAVAFDAFDEYKGALPAFSVAQCLETARREGAKILAALPDADISADWTYEGETRNNAGLCYVCRAALADGWCMDILVSPLDGKVYNVIVTGNPTPYGAELE